MSGSVEKGCGVAVLNLTAGVTTAKDGCTTGLGHYEKTGEGYVEANVPCLVIEDAVGVITHAISEFRLYPGKILFRLDKTTEKKTG